MPTPRPFRYIVLSCALFMLAGSSIGAVRLLPPSFRQGMAWGTIWPLLASALSALFETALVLATPIGLALAAKSTAAATRIESAGGSAVFGPELKRAIALWFLLAVGVGAYGNSRFGTPGLVARNVVRGARESCLEHQGYRVEPVPLADAKWICSPSGAPRFYGEWRKNGAHTKYSASGIQLSEDLAYVDLTDLDLSAVLARGTPALHLAVVDVRIRGTWPWSRQSKHHPIGRAFLVAALAVMTGVVAIMLAARSRVGWRFNGLLIAGVGAVTNWGALGLVDGNPHWHIGSYAVVPVVSLLTMALTAVIVVLRQSNP